MFDVEAIISWLQGLPTVGVYVFLWFTTYIENLFPPSPSDVLLLFIATLIGIGTIDFVPAVGVATLGSVMGFLTAFILGRGFGRRLLSTNKLPFLTTQSLKKVDTWFDKYGYGVIVVNRFLAGTRAVISFFAGMSELDLVKTTLLCAVSALAWNILVISIGSYLGENWQKGEAILSQYGLVVTILIGAIAVFFIVRWLYRRNRKEEVETEAGDDSGSS